MERDESNDTTRLRIRIDTPLPFHDLDRCRWLIASAAKLGDQEAFRILGWLATPSRESRRTSEEMEGLLSFWDRQFDHPLKARIAALCRYRFRGERPPREQVTDLLEAVHYKFSDVGIHEAAVSTCGGYWDLGSEELENSLAPGLNTIDAVRPDPARIHVPSRELGVCDVHGLSLLEPQGLQPRELVLAALRDGVDLWRAHLDSINLSGADLNGAGLPNVSLRQADLSGASCMGAEITGRFDGADMRRIDLNSARLMHSRFTGAKLQGANLWNADLEGAVFEDCDPNDLAGAIMPDGRVWEEYRSDHLRGIVDDSESLARVIDAWDEHVWARCPMHAAFGWLGLGDAPPAIQVRVGCWQALHDSGMLERPRS